MLAVLLCAVAAAPPQGVPLTDIAAVMHLTRQEAARGLPVRLTGTVTYADPVRRDFFLQQGSAAISMWYPDPRVPLRTGDRIEISGITDAGDFAPKIEPDPTSLRVLGHAALPEAEPLTLALVANGSHDCRLLAFEGLVRRTQLVDGRREMAVQSPVGRVRLLWQDTGPDELVDLVGAWVRARAVFATDLDPRGQVAGLRAYVPSPRSLEVVEPPVSTDRLPERALDELLRFAPTSAGFGRLRTTGTVTLVRPNGAFFVEDGKAGALVEPVVKLPRQVGERVLVVGFPALDETITLLLDAAVSSLGPGVLPAPPAPRTVEELADASLEGRLVRVEVLLQESGRLTSGSWFSGKMLVGGGLIDARLPPGIEPASYRSGSLIEFTGVRLPLVSKAFGPRTPLLALRSAADVRLLAPPPLWSRGRVLLGLAALAALLLGLSLFQRLRLRSAARLRDRLEHEVAERTEELRAANELVNAADRERTRMVALIAHDLRSPLTVISVNAALLEQAPATDEAERAASLGDIRSAADRLNQLIGRFLDTELAEMRRFSPQLETVDLARAAEAAVARLAATARIKGQQLELRIKGPSAAVADPRLLGHALDNLIDNACKYSQRGGSVRVEVEAARPVVLVKDCGPGMSEEARRRLFTGSKVDGPAPTGGEPSAGVGLLLVRQWLEAMGGRVECDSRLGEGSTFRVVLQAAPPGPA